MSVGMLVSVSIFNHFLCIHFTVPGMSPQIFNKNNDDDDHTKHTFPPDIRYGYALGLLRCFDVKRAMTKQKDSATHKVLA